MVENCYLLPATEFRLGGTQGFCGPVSAVMRFIPDYEASLSARLYAVDLGLDH